MSEVSREVTSEHFRYLAERTVPEDDFLKQLKQAAIKEGIPSIWIAPEQASLMQILLKLCKARVVVEVGTLAGYSAIAMARALPAEGCVHTIELEDQYADFAERWIAKSDVSGKIKVHRGRGNEVLTIFSDDYADAAFLDADKVNYRFYLDQCLRIVRSGGAIMVDNAFAFGRLFEASSTDHDVLAIQEFNDLISSVKELHSIIVPLGDGCWVGIKH